jgi:hypothetical protein
MWNNELVKQVREGKLAIELNHCDTQEELRDLLKYCFPKDKDLAFTNSRYYFKWGCYWQSSISTNLPSKSIKKFKMKYTKEDWVKEKVALEWENDKANKINKFFKECNSYNSYVNGAYKYYICLHRGGAWSGRAETTLPIVKIDDIVMEEEFVLPDTYIVECSNTEETNIVANYIKNCQQNWEYYKYVINHKGLIIKNHTDFNLYCEIPEVVKHLPILTFEEFTKHVFKKENMKEKQIIGYKLIKPEYAEAVNLITQTSYSKKGLEEISSDYSIKKLKEAGVLDIWFEPVYKEEKQLPKINGYDGKISGNQIVYGSSCAKFIPKFFQDLVKINDEHKILGGNRTIKSIKLDSDVEITIEQIKEIVEFLKEN